MVDNFNIICDLLTFDSEDDFYMLQILMRKKENRHLGSNSRLIKTYSITSVEQLRKHETEIKQMCTIFNARACINLNRRSFERIAFQTLRKIADQIMNKEFKSARKAFDSVCGSYSNEGINKKWILDCDFKYNDYQAYLIIHYVNKCKPEGDKLLGIIPTKSGFHIITKPFSLQEFKAFKERYIIPDFDIQKDNPTILFIPEIKSEENGKED